MIQDLEIKQKIIAEKLDIIKRRYDYLEYKTMMTDEVSDDLPKYELIVNQCNTDDLRVIENLNRGRQRRIKTLKVFIQNKVFNHAQNNAYFGTLTLNEDYVGIPLENLKRRIKRVLLKHCQSVVLNVDYGSINNRLHFHCVVLCDDIEALENDYKFGFTLFKPINLEENDKKKISKYLSKLTYHAIKSSTPNSFNNSRCYYYTIY